MRSSSSCKRMPLLIGSVTYTYVRYDHTHGRRRRGLPPHMHSVFRVKHVGKRTYVKLDEVDLERGGGREVLEVQLVGLAVLQGVRVRVRVGWWWWGGASSVISGRGDGGAHHTYTYDHIYTCTCTHPHQNSDPSNAPRRARRGQRAWPGRRAWPSARRGRGGDSACARGSRRRG